MILIGKEIANEIKKNCRQMQIIYQQKLLNFSKNHAHGAGSISTRIKVVRIQAEKGNS
jgi:hypothetical protein